MTSTTAVAPSTFGSALRRLYFIRFGFAIVWALLVILAATSAGPLLTVLVVLYPLVDAVAVVWQLRAEGASQATRVPEWINVAASVVAAVGLGFASAASLSAVLAVWGVWAIVAGLVQLLAAVLRRKAGGQVPLIVSGAISILAGGAFAAQGVQHAASATGIGGYAILGGVFFLMAAIRLSVLLRRA
jgi:uncharacterized membrane protein HdeD (DUF308 family)